jgi:nucleoid-associated protein EbfC
MFDQLKNMAALPGLLAKARDMQDRMKQMQEDLGKKTVIADAGAGIVTATVNGKSAMDDTDVRMLEDLVVAAVSAAQTKAADLMQMEMARIAQDLGLPPGMLPGQ